MQNYFIAILGAVSLTLLVRLIAPEGEGGGVGRHFKLLTSLFLLLVILSPMKDVIENLRSPESGDLFLPNGGSGDSEEYKDALEETLKNAEKTYFAEELTKALEEKFTIQSGNLRIAVKWKTHAERAEPERITVILSGAAIWKDPHVISDYVTTLLGCPCETAIE